MNPIPAGTGSLERLRPWIDITAAEGAAVAADSETVVYRSNDAGFAQPYAVPRIGGTPRRLWDAPGRVGAILPSPLRPELLIARDAGGNEHWQIELLPLSGTARSPKAVTADPGVIHNPGIWDATGDGFYFTSNARDRRFFDVYWVDPHLADPPRAILKEDTLLDVLDRRGDQLLLARHPTNLDAELLLGREDGWQVLNPHTEEQFVPSAGVGADAVYAAANPNRERAALVRFKPGGTRPEILREYTGEVELVRVAPDGRSLLAFVNRDGWSETHLYTPATGEDRPLLSGPKGVISSAEWCPDGSGFVYSLSYTDGTEVYYRGIETGKERKLTRSGPRPPTPPVEPKLQNFRASDRLTVPYWEYPPTRRPERGTLVYVHGGPEAQARPAFQPVLQYLVAEGWRVIAPNVRGSLGYGRTYVHLDDGARRMDSVRDLKELVEHLVAEKRSVPGRIAVAGGSYGGYMVLASLTSYPELFAAGIDIVGIANFLTFLEKTGPWRRRLREAEYGRLVEDREMLRAISPLFQADRIVAPLFVVHGRNDPRVPFHEAEQIVESLRKRGRPVELLEYADEGHGLHRRDHRLEVWSRAVEFLDRNIPPP